MAYLLPTPPSRRQASFLQLGDGIVSVDRFVAAMRAFKSSPTELAHVRDVALDLVRDTAPYDQRGEVRAVFRFVRDSIRYVQDVVNVDTLQTPTATLDRLQGDCDDKALLLAALLECIGFATRFVVAATRPGQSYNHVYLETWVPQLGRWVPLETSVAGFPPGRALPSYEPLRRYP